MAKFMVLRNERTSFYEVHVEGCAHKMARHQERMSGSYEAETGQQVAVEFEEGNEGCLAVLGPCAKAGAVNEKARRAASLEREFG